MHRIACTKMLVKASLCISNWKSKPSQTSETTHVFEKHRLCTGADGDEAVYESDRALPPHLSLWAGLDLQAAHSSVSRWGPAALQHPSGTTAGWRDLTFRSYPVLTVFTSRTNQPGHQHIPVGNVEILDKEFRLYIKKECNGAAFALLGCHVTDNKSLFLKTWQPYTS